MALDIDTKFEGKLTCTFKNEMRNLAKFSSEHVRKSKHLDFYWVLLSKIKNM